MAKSDVNSVRHGRSWLRIVGWLFLILFVLLVALYFVATSAPFFKRFVLPRVSDSINADVTVSDASISPFTSVTLRNLKVQPRGDETLITVTEVRVRHSLLDIIRGTIRVDELTLVSPVVTVVTHPDGTSNLDPILASRTPDDRKSEPANLDVRRVSLRNGTVRQVKEHSSTHRDVTELSNLNVTLSNLKNADSGKLTVAGAFSMENNPPPPAERGSALATVNGEYTFALSSDLKPISVLGNLLLLVTRADGSLADMNAFGINLTCDVTPTEIKQLAIQFQREGAQLGELRASGPFDMNTTEGRLRVQLVSLDRRILNILGAGQGLDFGTTSVNSTNDIQFSNGGATIAAAGTFNASRVQLTRQSQTTPTLNLMASYDVTVDRNSSNAVLRALTLDGTQNGAPLLRGELTRPMNLSWGGAAGEVGDSTLNLTLTNLSLAQWKPFLGDNAPDGVASGRLQLLSQQGGEQLTFDLAAAVTDLSAMIGSNRIAQAELGLRSRGESAELTRFNIQEFHVELKHQAQPALAASGSGTYDTSTEAADLQLVLEASLAPLLNLFPQPDIAASSGSLQVNGRVQQQAGSQSLVGNMALANFSGQFGSNVFHEFGAAVELDVASAPERIEIRKAAGRLTERGQPGGVFDVSGWFNPSNHAAEIRAALSDFNQNGLRPFLEPMLANQTLVSVSLNGNALLQHDPSASSSVRADVHFANLVVTNAQQRTPPQPLEARAQIDAALTGQVADLRQFQIALTPTERARNELRLEGRIDMSRSNAVDGNLTLASDALDLTRYYDLFAGPETAAPPQPAPRGGQQPPTAAASTPGFGDRTEEPEAMGLPIGKLAVDARIARLYLRELDITNCQAVVNIEGSRVRLDPFHLAINGAPVTSTIDLDLGVPGYRYQIAFNAGRVPLQPLADSFAPEYRGRAQGELNADVSIEGAGLTGASLQRSLNGRANLVFTNANIILSGRKMRPILTTIGLALGTPEIADSPVTWIVADARFGQGQINLARFDATGPAFTASSRGSIPIAPILNNSRIPNLPVNFGISRNLAQQARFNMSNVPTNAPHMELGTIAQIGGTLGNPSTRVDGARIAVLTAEQYLPGQAGDVLRAVTRGAGGTNATGNLLQGVGNILTGRSAPATNTPPTTNAPSSGSTTNPPAQPNQSPLQGILNEFLGPGNR